MIHHCKTVLFVCVCWGGAEVCNLKQESGHPFIITEELKIAFDTHLQPNRRMSLGELRAASFPEIKRIFK